MIPKWTLSIPKLSITGSNIGTRRSFAGTPSTTHPTKIIKTRSKAKNTFLDSVKAKIE